MENSSKPRKRILSFDIIRVVACFCVITVHFNAALSNYQNGVFLYNNGIIPSFYYHGRIYLGALGVSVFFLLSGASLFLSNRKNTGLGNFYKKRILSIYPAFWIAFLTATAVDFLIYKGIPTQNPWRMLVSAAGMDAYFVTRGIYSLEYYKLGEWFLGCIILIYILYPLLQRAVERVPVLAGACAVLSYGAGVYAMKAGVPYASDSSLMVCVPKIVFGMLFVRYGLQNRPRICLTIGISVLAVVLLGERWLANETITLLTAVFLFTSLAALFANVNGEKLQTLLEKASVLTFPMFLVHHWLIYKLIDGFYLPELPRMYIVLLYSIYITLSIMLSRVLLKVSGKFTDMLRSSKLLMGAATAMVIAGLCATAIFVF